MLRPILSAVAALALSACASTSGEQAAAPDAARNDCFHADSAHGFSYIDNEHIGLSVGANRKYILTTMFNARDLDWTQVIAVRSTTSWICTGNGLGVSISGGDPHRTYPISRIERAPDEAPAPEGS